MSLYQQIVEEANKAYAEPSVGDRFYRMQFGTPVILTVVKVMASRVVLEDGTYINLKSKNHSDKYYFQPLTSGVETQWVEQAEMKAASEGLREMVLEVQAKVAKLPTRDLHDYSVEYSGALRTKLEAILAVLGE